ncbi:MAG: type 1 glutamine amidotransferase domain-containing protein [Bacteroidales bacterium]
MKLKNLVFAGVILGALIMLAGCQLQEQDKDKDKKKDVDKTKIAVLVGEGFQDAEAYMPIGYFTNKGAYIKVLGPETGEVKAYNSDFTIKIEKAIEDAEIDYFDALIIPGGKAPSKLRENEAVVEFAREFFNSGKPVASICHGPQILVTAGVLEGRTSTAYEEVQEEIEEAGATFVDDSLVVDDNYITSRFPDDLPYFCKALEDALNEEGLLKK